MKNIIFSIAAVIIVITAISCNQSSNKNNDQSVNGTLAASEAQASSQLKENDAAAHAVGDTLKGQGAQAIAKEETKSFSIEPIVTDYLSLKNALVSDDDKAAASAGKQLLATLNKMDMKSIPTDKHKQYMDIADDAKENAEHIGDNAGKIEHQREHLAFLSEDLKDLIALLGTPQKLYQDHCPMFNDGKGAIWLSETKEIKNPYYGSKMISCGKVEKTIENKL